MSTFYLCPLCNRPVYALMVPVTGEYPPCREKLVVDAVPISPPTDMGDWLGQATVHEPHQCELRQVTL